MKRAMYLICLLGGISSCAQAELRIWEDRKGNSLKAEYINVFGDKVSLRYPSGKIGKFNVAGFSDKDQVYIQLQNPPKLSIKKVERSGKQTTDYSRLTDEEVEKFGPQSTDYYRFRNEEVKEKKHTNYTAP